MKAYSLAFIILFASSNVLAADVGCKKSPALTGRCYIVSGSLGLSADAGITLGRDDTHRSILIRPAPNSREDIPDAVIEALDRAQSKTGHLSTRIHGVFEVCPTPIEDNQFGATQFGCIANGSHLSLEP